MEAIVAADREWGIGRQGGLLAHLPGDLRYFKEKTWGRPLLMGRKTLESLPGGKPLPGRKNYVLSRSRAFAEFVEQKKKEEREQALPPEKIRWGNCEAVSSLEEFRKEQQRDPAAFAELMVIGGAEVYRQCLPYCDRIYVTRMEAALSADCFFENLDLRPEWEQVQNGKPQEENGIRYRFTIYQRKEAQR